MLELSKQQMELFIGLYMMQEAMLIVGALGTLIVSTVGLVLYLIKGVRLRVTAFITSTIREFKERKSIKKEKEMSDMFKRYHDKKKEQAKSINQVTIETEFTIQRILNPYK